MTINALAERAEARKTSGAYTGEVTAQECWEALSEMPDAMLVDVRTSPEWAFAGEPDLSALSRQLLRLSWKFFPGFDTNPDFIAQLEASVPSKSAPLFFLCKTGGRSLDAANAAAESGYATTFNVTSGFEGDATPEGQRGRLNGWKASGLPWRQA